LGGAVATEEIEEVLTAETPFFNLFRGRQNLLGSAQESQYDTC